MVLFLISLMSLLALTWWQVNEFALSLTSSYGNDPKSFVTMYQKYKVIKNSCPTMKLVIDQYCFQTAILFIQKKKKKGIPKFIFLHESRLLKYSKHLRSWGHICLYFSLFLIWSSTGVLHFEEVVDMLVPGCGHQLLLEEALLKGAELVLLWVTGALSSSRLWSVVQERTEGS